MYPFTEEQKQACYSMDQKLSFIIKKLEDQYGNLVDGFVSTLKRKNKEMNYEPKVVIIDEGVDEFDEDDEDQ